MVSNTNNNIPEERARDFDTWAMSLAKHAATRSTCARRNAGAVAVDDQRRIVSIGYNGVPSGYPHCTPETPCPGAFDKSGDTSNCMAIHAEVNCIIHSRDPYRIHTMYVTASPCKNCALVLANLPNLKRVVYGEDYPDDRGLAALRRNRIKLEKLEVGE